MKKQENKKVIFKAPLPKQKIALQVRAYVANNQYKKKESLIIEIKNLFGIDVVVL